MLDHHDKSQKYGHHRLLNGIHLVELSFQVSQWYIYQLEPSRGTCDECR